MRNDRCPGRTWPAVKTVARAGLALALCAAAGCTSNKSKPEAVAVDPNLYPAGYKQQLATFMSTQLLDPADFRFSFVAPPALMQVGDSQHYVVCVMLNGRNQHKDKVAIYLAGAITQFIDAQPEQCANAAYEPFKELAALTPTR